MKKKCTCQHREFFRYQQHFWELNRERGLNFPAKSLLTKNFANIIRKTWYMQSYRELFWNFWEIQRGITSVLCLSLAQNFHFGETEGVGVSPKFVMNEILVQFSRRSFRTLGWCISSLSYFTPDKGISSCLLSSWFFL